MYSKPLALPVFPNPKFQRTATLSPCQRRAFQVAMPPTPASIPAGITDGSRWFERSEHHRLKTFPKPQRRSSIPAGITEGSRWFERSEHHRIPMIIKFASPTGAQIDLRSLREHQASEGAFRRCAAARRPPATFLYPFGISGRRLSELDSPGQRPGTTSRVIIGRAEGPENCRQIAGPLALEGRVYAIRPSFPGRWPGLCKLTSLRPWGRSCFAFGPLLPAR